MSGETQIGFPEYISHKRVNAAQIKGVVDRGSDSTTDENPLVDIFFEDKAYLPMQRINLRGKPTPAAGWYMVIYDGGYYSFSPKKAFEDGHSIVDHNQAPTPVAIRDYGYALSMVKAGALMEREGWNGKGQFIFLVPGSTFKVNRHPLLGIFEEGTEVNYHSHIDLRNAQGQIVPWTPSQGDQLAEDWRQVERPS